MGIFEAIQSVISNKIINSALTKEESIEDVINNIKAQVDVWENTEVKIAITGQSGSGKSSLINAIAGSKIAPVGFVETTMEPKEYKTENGILNTGLAWPACKTTNLEAKYDIIPQKNKLIRFDIIAIGSWSFSGKSLTNASTPTWSPYLNPALIAKNTANIFT